MLMAYYIFISASSHFAPLIFAHPRKGSNAYIIIFAHLSLVIIFNNIEINICCTFITLVNSGEENHSPIIRFCFSKIYFLAYV